MKFVRIRVLYLIIFLPFIQSGMGCTDTSNKGKYEKEQKEYLKAVEKAREKIYHRKHEGNILFYSSYKIFGFDVKYIQVVEIDTDENGAKKENRIMWEIRVKDRVNGFHPAHIVYGKTLPEYEIKTKPKPLKRGRDYRISIASMNPYIDGLEYDFKY